MLKLGSQIVVRGGFLMYAELGMIYLHKGRVRSDPQVSCYIYLYVVISYLFTFIKYKQRPAIYHTNALGNRMSIRDY